MTANQRFDFFTTRGLLLVILLAGFGAFFLLVSNNSDFIHTQLVPQPYMWTSLQQTGNQTGVQMGDIDLSLTKEANTVHGVSERHFPSGSHSQEQQSFTISSDLNAIHFDRTQHVKSVCSKHRLNASLGIKTCNLMYSEKYNIAYRNIPKIGSTFLTQMFMVLNRGSEKADDVFGKMRMQVHMQTGGLYRKLDAKTLHDTLTLIPTRNPYTRLYSAYVDKVYLPLAFSLTKAVMSFGNKQSSSCGVYDTFESFLKYALRANTNRIMADHYASPYKAVSNIVCKLNNFMLVKQESFSSDIEYALLKSKTGKEDFDAIFSALHDRRVESTIPGIVRTIYSRARPIPRTCFPWIMVAKRTWKSFQIQGFLSDDLEFPDDKFSSDRYADPEFLIKIILESITLKPLSSEESKAQRRNALLNEYKKVDPKIIQQIQKVYAMDFEIYQYDIDLNSIH